VRKISFTGSTATGERIIRAAGVKKPSSVEFDGPAEGNETKAGEVSLREEWWRLLLEV
jgi:hypothetical protein